MDAMTKLSRTQQELLDAMESGVIVCYMRYVGILTPVPYYFRSDTMERCTAAANSLLAKGLIEKINVKQFGDHDLRIKGNHD